MHEIFLIDDHTSSRCLIILNSLKNYENRLVNELSLAKVRHDYNLALLRLLHKGDKIVKTKQNLIENAKQSDMQIMQKAQELSRTTSDFDDLRLSVFSNKNFAKREQIITRAYQRAYRWHKR